MAENLVKFVYAASATPEQIAAFSSDTLYFIGGATAGDGGKLYKGPRLYDAGAGATASELAQLKTYIGTLPVSAEYDDLIDYIDKNIAAAIETAEGYTDTLDNSLAAVAKSGNAADVAIEDEGGKITAANVEDALAELADAIGDAETAGAVTLTSASGSGDTLTTYTLAQGGTTVGTINIPKDYLVRSAEIEVVDTADEPYEGAVVGDKYIDFVINTKDGQGTGTAQHIYIPLNELVAVMSGGTTDEVTVAIDEHNEITATIGEISGDKIIYAEGTGGAADITVNDKLDALEEAIGDGIEALDGTAGIATVSAGIVTLKAGIVEEDGVIDNSSDSDITLAKVATTGAAGDVAYGASTVSAALDTIGTIPAGATASTVVGYVDEKTAAVVANLDADVDASGTAQHSGTFVVSGITEADGVITGVDSVEVENAGAAAAAEQAAKTYANGLLTWGSLASS